jgi:hypothetical protein
MFASCLRLMKDFQSCTSNVPILHYLSSGINNFSCFHSISLSIIYFFGIPRRLVDKLLSNNKLTPCSYKKSVFYT